MDDPIGSIRFGILGDRAPPSAMDLGGTDTEHLIDHDINEQESLLGERSRSNKKKKESNPFLRMIDFSGGIGSRTRTNHNPMTTMEVDVEYQINQHDNREGNKKSDEGWAAVSNLDVFFERLYTYYHEQGFSAILAKRITNLITLGFTVIFSTFLFGFVKWDELIKCRDSDTCHEDFSEYFGFDEKNPARVLFVELYFIVCSVYWAWSCLSLFLTFKTNLEVRTFYRQKLHIETRELQTMEWCEVVDRLIALQESGRYRFQINNSKLTARNIAMRIMRKDNFMLALINHNVLPIGSQFCGEAWFLGKNLEMSLYYCIFYSLFDSRCLMSKPFLQDPSRLRRRFFAIGLLNLLIMPFSLGFVVMFFFLKNAEELHSKKNYLGPRWWSPYALWEFRELNELPHIFQRRLYASLRHAEGYVRQFPSPVPTVIASGISFIAGGVLGILILFTFIDDDSILLHVKLYGRNLFWYVAIFSAVLALSRALVPPDEERVFTPNTVMRKVVAYTHYLPDTWRSRCHTFDVRDAFCDLFQYRVILFLREVMCILTTPFILMFVLPRYVEDVLNFLRIHTKYEEGIGDICIFSLLNLKDHGDHRYGASKRQSASNSSSQHLHLFGGKLEKSWLNFRSNYPTWEDDQELQSEGVNLLEKLSSFQEGSVQEVMRKFGDPQDCETSVASMSGSIILNSSVVSNVSHNNNKSVATVQGLFDNDQSVAMPLGSMKFPNAENYFYWLEEYRDDQANSKL